VYLGVDAGNSKTVALVCDATGAVRGAARTGIGDIYGAPSAAAAVDAVVTAVRTALGDAGVGAAAVSGAAFRLAGVDWPEDHRYWHDVLRDRLPDLPCASVLNDGFAPLRCGVLDGVGVAVVVGTGPAVAARGPGGREHSLGWWLQGPLGATGLGDSALRAVYDADLGLTPPTALTAALLAVYGDRDVEELLHAFTRREDRRGWLDRGRAARAVLATAVAGDAVAAAIVTAQAQLFADHARVAATRVAFPADAVVPVVLAGSVLGAPDSLLSTALVRALSERLPGARITRSDLPPVAGAVLDAMAEAGARPTPATVATLRASAPPAEFLRT